MAKGVEIVTSYFGGIKKIKGAGYKPVAIVLFPPKWFMGTVYQILAPAKKLFYNKNLTEEEWAKEFKKQLSLLDRDKIVKDIIKITQSKKLALICYEPPEEFCHRHIVAEWLNEGGYNVKEYHKNTKSLQQQLNLF